MKRPLLTLAASLSLSAAGFAQEPSGTGPFAVALGGQAVMAAALFGLFMLGGSGLRETRHLSPLPFSVTIAGQPAQASRTEAQARIAEPVPGDAEIVLGINGQPAFLHLVRMDEDGAPEGNLSSDLSIWKGSNCGRLDRICDGRKPIPGCYLLRITACHQSASVRLTVKAEEER